MVEMHTEFKSNYKVEWGIDLDGKELEQTYYFTNGPNNQDGFRIKVTVADGSAWLGVFSADGGDLEHAAIYHCPNPDLLCVVVHDKAYFVSVVDPAAWRDSDAVGVRDVISDVNNELLLLISDTNVQAYGVSGVVWRTKRVSWDGIRIIGIEHGVLLGEAYDPMDTNEEWKAFRVNLLNGKHEGGSFKD